MKELETSLQESKLSNQPEFQMDVSKMTNEEARHWVNRLNHELNSRISTEVHFDAL